MKGKRLLMKTLGLILKPAFLQPGVPRVFMLLFTIAQPLLLARPTEFPGQDAAEQARK